MRGATQLKRRHASQNERRAVWNAFRVVAAKTFQIKHVMRLDLSTGEITESSRSKMNAETFWFNTFEPLKNRLALPQSLVWEELEAGAALFTEHAKFWIENARPAPAAPVQPAPKTKSCKSEACNDYGTPAIKNDLCTDCYEQAKSDEFYQSGEIDLHYWDVV